MLELQGRYNKALIYNDDIESEAVAQIILLLNQEFVKDSKIRIMPDVHAGAGCTVGTTMTITDKIVPNLVGVDIGCGMLCIKLKEKEIDFSEFDRVLRERVPSGFATREKAHIFSKEIPFSDLYCRDAVDLDKSERSIGTLGGGNHFIEVDKDSEGYLYLVIHSGSRHFGLEVAGYHQRAGYDALNGASREEIDKIIKELKAKGKSKEIEQTIKTLKNTKRTNVPKDLCYVEGRFMKEYLADLAIAQQFASLNRKAMASELMKTLGLNALEEFETIHNYIDLENMILRKGAVSAKDGERLIIPMNMRDGSLICIGKGNEEWNQSAPHGAGRVMSRSRAKSELSMEDFEASMEGIYTTSVSESTIDESPMAYKSMELIMSYIQDTVDIENIIKPVYNFKAGEERQKEQAK